ncbi:hypothetical protein D929_02688 [Enterococcus faecalis 02-MB-P-10]|nr:hypothetical protein D929_02688 [Enterococcus faecalis 02-MB-P-10]
MALSGNSGRLSLLIIAALFVTHLRQLLVREYSMYLTLLLKYVDKNTTIQFFWFLVILAHYPLSFLHNYKNHGKNMLSWHGFFVNFFQKRYIYYGMNKQHLRTLLSSTIEFFSVSSLVI